MKPPYTLRILTAICIASTLAMFAFTIGCGTVASVKPSITNTNGDLGGSIEIVFKDVNAVQKTVIVQRKLGTSRGYTLDGQFVSLGTLKSYAIAAYQHGQDSRQVANTYRLDEFDRQTIEIVIVALARAGATSFNP